MCFKQPNEGVVAWCFVFIPNSCGDQMKPNVVTEELRLRLKDVDYYHFFRFCYFIFNFSFSSSPTLSGKSLLG